MTPVAKKLIPVALVAAILGGTAGAIIVKTVHSNQQAIPAAASTTTPAPVADQSAPASTTPAATDNSGLNGTDQQAVATAENRTTTRTAYRTVTRSPRYTSRRAYYDYNSQAQKRTFWDKHRDKLTVAMGAGGGALVGGLLGGRKGAAIGMLGGGGGSALYTYKIRKRNPR